MKLMRIGAPGEERPLVSLDGASWYDARSVAADFDAELFAGDGLTRLREAVVRGDLAEVSLGDERIGSPIVRPPSILCVGMNYAAHAAESGALPPEDIVVFYKKSNTLAGPADPIRAVDAQSTLDWEVELGVVIGASLHGDISDQEAIAGIAGYVVADDLSDRWLQIERSGGQWSKGKSFPGSCALGPWMVTADEIPDPQALELRSWVNDQPRQASSTADMIFPVAQIVRDLARVMSLDPGDLILTGTPEGVALSGRYPYLQPGDVVRMTIQGLGEIEQRVLPLADKENQ